ncbi:MAG TPA: hypothetical protein VKA84_25910 [Gemmatimonadaceae bacterium]|nr:hypothetical protein [Gemmatimonadaceae bacterium]
MPRATADKTLYYFAVGGTGALTVEPLLLLCAAGVGPRRLAVVLIDADAANPALARAQALLKNYEQVREAFGKPEQGFFSTELVRTQRSQSVWSPLGVDAAQGGDLSLERFAERARMAGPNRAAGTLFDLLFSTEQQKEQLHEGFRGNPAIGSILMHGLKESTFLKELMNSARQDTGALFYAAGSIFGGTGASALPVLAEVLTGAGIARERIGAALVTPYYSLPEPGQGEQQNGRLKPDSSIFLRNTAAALPTYTHGHAKYGALYVIGDASSLPQVRTTYSAGGATQRNDPHALELFIALAAVDFVSREWEAADPPASRMMYATVGGEEPGWQDLPLTEDEKKELLTYIVAANFYLQYFGETRSGPRQQELGAELDRMVWFRDIGLDAGFVRARSRELDLLGRWFASSWSYLWASSHNTVALRLVDFSGPSAASVNAPQEYARSAEHATIPLPRVDKCLAGFSPRQKKGGFLGLGKGGDDQITSLAEVFAKFNTVKRSDVTGLPGFLAYLHDGIRKFVDDWYSPAKA